MATTLLFVELLVIGLGAAVWILLLFGTIARAMADVPAWVGNPAVTSVLLATSYVLGIILDRAAYSLFRRLELRLRDQVFGDDQNPPVEYRESFVLLVPSPLRDQVIYNRSRLRICRAWILNFALIGVFSAVYFVQRGRWVNAVLLLGGIGLSALAAFAARSLARDHYRNVRHSYEFLERNKDRTAKASA